MSTSVCSHVQCCWPARACSAHILVVWLWCVLASGLCLALITGILMGSMAWSLWTAQTPHCVLQSITFKALVLLRTPTDAEHSLMTHSLKSAASSLYYYNCVGNTMTWNQKECNSSLKSFSFYAQYNVLHSKNIVFLNVPLFYHK